MVAESLMIVYDPKAFKADAGLSCSNDENAIGTSPPLRYGSLVVGDRDSLRYPLLPMRGLDLLEGNIRRD